MTAQSDRPHIGIVGSGPAGFYTAQQILKVSSSKVTSCLARPGPPNLILGDPGADSGGEGKSKRAEK